MSSSRRSSLAGNVSSSKTKRHSIAPTSQNNEFIHDDNNNDDSKNYGSNRKRNTRRETANPAELEDLLHNLNDSDSSFGNSQHNNNNNNNIKNDYFNFGSADQILKSTVNQQQQQHYGDFLNDSSPLFSKEELENRSPVLSNASSSPVKLRRSSRVPSPSPSPSPQPNNNIKVSVSSPLKKKSSPLRRQSLAADDEKSITSSSSSFSDDPISFVQNKRRETVDSVDMEVLRNEMMNDISTSTDGVNSVGHLSPSSSSVQSLHGKMRTSLSTLATGSVFVGDMKLSPVQSVAAADRPIPTVF